jgi:hypothetical protein
MVEPTIDGLVIPAISYDAGFASYVLQADTGAVPEPASWVMMIAGFGAIGGALRRQSRRRLRYA